MQPKAEGMIRSPFLEHDPAEQFPAQCEPQRAQFGELHGEEFTLQIAKVLIPESCNIFHARAGRLVIHF